METPRDRRRQSKQQAWIPARAPPSEARALGPNDHQICKESLYKAPITIQGPYGGTLYIWGDSLYMGGLYLTFP